MPENELQGNTSGQDNLLTQYKEMKLQTNKANQEIYPQIRGSTINNPIVLSALDQRENTFNLVVTQPKFKKTNSREYFKTSQIKIKLDQVNMVDKFNLHKKTSYVTKLQNQLIQERTKNKA